MLQSYQTDCKPDNFHEASDISLTVIFACIAATSKLIVD
jgi:hypothetical protein